MAILVLERPEIKAHSPTTLATVTSEIPISIPGALALGQLRGQLRLNPNLRFRSLAAPQSSLINQYAREFHLDGQFFAKDLRVYQDKKLVGTVHPQTIDLVLAVLEKMIRTMQSNIQTPEKVYQKAHSLAESRFYGYSRSGQAPDDVLSFTGTPDLLNNIHSALGSSVYPYNFST